MVAGKLDDDVFFSKFILSTDKEEIFKGES